MYILVHLDIIHCHIPPHDIPYRQMFPRQPIAFYEKIFPYRQKQLHHVWLIYVWLSNHLIYSPHFPIVLTHMVITTVGNFVVLYLIDSLHAGW